jgi:predicted Zn-dependent protease
MYNENFIKDIGTKIIGYSKAQQTEVFIYGNLSSLSRFSENEITQNVTQEDINISVRVIHNNRIGKATTNRIDDPSLKQLASNAFEIALFQKEDKLITPLPGHQEYEEIKDAYDKETADYSAMDRAKAIKSVTDECEKQEINAAGIFSNNTAYICLMNSKGLYAYNKITGAEFSITATKNKRAGWAEKIAKKVKDINTLDIANIAIKKSINGQNPSDIEPGKYTVVLEPAAVTDFMSYLGFLGFGALRELH